MKRKTKGTLATFLGAGLAVVAVFVARNIADGLAEGRAIAGVERLGGLFRRVEKTPSLPPWLAWASPFTSTNFCWVAFLDGARVTDAGVKELASIRQLKQLSLDGTQITDVGLKDLAPLKELEELYLGGTQITDASLRDLAVLTQLQTLDLNNTKVTDAGLKELAALKQLTKLNLWKTQVTDASVKELEKALPGCKINTTFNGFICGFGQGVLTGQAE